MKWPHIEFALLNFSYELLIIFGLSSTIQSTPCEHWTTVKKSFFNSQWKASNLVSVKINNGGTRTLVDSDILKKKDVLWTPKKFVMIVNKKVYFLLEKVCTNAYWWLYDNWNKYEIVTLFDYINDQSLKTCSYIFHVARMTRSIYNVRKVIFMSRKHIANQAKYSFMKQSIVRRI